jgi:hypothetical protein
VPVTPCTSPPTALPAEATAWPAALLPLPDTGSLVLVVPAALPAALLEDPVDPSTPESPWVTDPTTDPTVPVTPCTSPETVLPSAPARPLLDEVAVPAEVELPDDELSDDELPEDEAPEEEEPEPAVWATDRGGAALVPEAEPLPVVVTSGRTRGSAPADPPERGVPVEILGWTGGRCELVW